jgi:hypothetical protein
MINPQQIQTEQYLIDGKKVSFNKEILTNYFYLPYNYTNTPIILPKLSLTVQLYTMLMHHIKERQMNGRNYYSESLIICKLIHKVVFEVLP